MAVYIIACELHKRTDYDQINERLSRLGDCIRPLSSFWLVNTAMSYHELYNHINAAVERNDMFYITSISSAGFGRLDPEDTNWIKKKFFIPLDHHATSVNTRGPLSMGQQVPLKKQPAAVQKSAADRKKPSASNRQRYPEKPGD